MSEHERTGWRDEAISKKHRDWGFNCPCADIDFLAVEYNVGKPVALVEYKHEMVHVPNFDHATYRALTALANAAKLPFMVVFYHPDDWWFTVHPMNEIAQRFYDDAQTMSELEFVKSLYNLRQIVMEHYVMKTLNTVKPEARL